MTCVVGVIGGIGSGKSAVSAVFGRLGARILDADALAHEVLEMAEVRVAIRNRFGGEVFGVDGSVDRALLAQKVFGTGNEDAREALNGMVHPRVRERIIEGMEAARRDQIPIVILDIPLLLNSPFKNSCDHILFVKSNRDIRAQRVRARGWDEDELEKREASQIPLAEKERASDIVIENNGTLDELTDRIQEIHDQLVVC